MSLIQLFEKELEQEAQTTRKMLERIPTDKFSWKPHEKSMTIQRLATHIAELPSWIGFTLPCEELDFATTSYKADTVNNTEELMRYFEKSLAEGKAALEKSNDNQLLENWTMRNGSVVYFTATKGEVMRMIFSQVIHHRAQLGVYLRLLNIPIPGSYGPSADEQTM